MIAPVVIIGRETGETRKHTPVSRPMRQRQPQFKIPKIDTDTASRDRLIEHIEELEWLLESILPEDVEIQRVRDAFAISKQRATILVALASGRVVTNEHLCLTIGRFEDELAPATIKAQIWHIRNATERFGVRINLIWGVGYQLDADSVPLVQSILNGEC